MERISINSRAIERKDVEEMNDVKIWPYRILPPFLLPKRMDGRRKSLAGGDGFRWLSRAGNWVVLNLFVLKSKRGAQN